MTGDQVLKLVGVLLVAAVLLFAVWRYSRLRVKLRVPLGEGELTGEDGKLGSDSNVGKSSQGPSVATQIGGNVQGSRVSTVGGSTGAVSPRTPASSVRTDIGGSVTGSDVKTTGGDAKDDRR